MSVTVSMSASERYYQALKALAAKKNSKPSRLIREAVDAMFGKEIEEILVSFFADNAASTPQIVQINITPEGEEVFHE